MGLGSFATPQAPTFRTSYVGPRLLQGLVAKLRGLGDVQFDLEGLQQHLSVRPMTLAYANGVIQNAQGLIADQAAQGNSTAQGYDASQALLSAGIEANAAGQDPLPNNVADDVANAVLKAYGSANTVSTVLAQNVADTGATYQFLSDIPKDIGQAIGTGVNAGTNLLGAGLWEVVKNTLTNPTTWLVVGAAYLLFYRKKSAT